MSRSIPINRFSTHDCVGISNATLKLAPFFTFIVSCLNDQMFYSIALDRINSLCTNVACLQRVPSPRYCVVHPQLNRLLLQENQEV